MRLPIVVLLGFGLFLAAAPDGGAQTRTQTYQPGEPMTGLPGGAPGRGYGSAPSGQPSVYCQIWGGQPRNPQYRGTGPQTPCIPGNGPGSSPGSGGTKEVKISITALAWINMRTNPFMTPLGQYAALGGLAGPVSALVFQPDWVPKTYVGLIGTRNPIPPLQLGSPQGYAQTQAFRSLMSCTILITVDVRSGQPIAARLAGPLLDPGWTPPFNISLFPPMMVRTLPFIEDPDLADPSYYSGELGVVSGIYATRHPNSMLYPNGGSLSGNARILADAVMMFRAGEHTDDIGVRSAHAAFHVPWVWNEFALVYTNGAYYLRAAAAKFPTTWWYVNGNMVHEQAEAVDTTIPGTFKIPFYYVTPQNLVIYPVLAAGAKTHDAKGNLVPQSPNKQYAGPINTFPYAAPGAPPWQMAVSPQ